MGLSEGELARCMRMLIKGGLLGDYEGKAVMSDILKQHESTITFVAGLFDLTTQSIGEKNLICLNKTDGSLTSNTPVAISEEEMQTILSEGNLGVLEEVMRLDSGSYGISYKVSLKDSPRQIMIQLRYHGNLDSMNNLTEYLSENLSAVIPVPRTYRSTFQVSSNFRVQVSEFVAGDMGNTFYYQLPVSDKMQIVKEIARVFDAMWRFKSSEVQSLIGEAIVSRDPFSIKVGPDRKYGLGGPFSSVTDYLKAWINHCLEAMEERQLIEEFKEDVLPGVHQLLERGLVIPPQVEDIPVVLSHADLALYNMIFSSSDPRELKAVIDWELVDCTPFAVAVPSFIEPLFWNDLRGKNKQAEGSFELREAFWDEIPYWKNQLETEAAQSFLEWYQLGRSLEAYPPMDDDTTPEQRRALWKENTDYIERFLEKQRILEHI